MLLPGGEVEPGRLQQPYVVPREFFLFGPRLLLQDPLVQKQAHAARLEARRYLSIRRARRNFELEYPGQVEAGSLHLSFAPLNDHYHV